MQSDNRHAQDSPHAELDSQLESARQLVDESTRRSFFSRCTSVVMAFGMAAGYGLFGWIIARFIYPRQRQVVGWQFVGRIDQLAIGASLTYETPAGQHVTLTRLDDGDRVESFIALSSVCPHLGCRVHWQQTENRFFCPCHNGAFDVQGRATAGPPQAAKQSLPRYPLRVENGLLFIQVPIERLV